MSTRKTSLTALVAALLLLAGGAGAAAQSISVERTILPSEADPAAQPPNDPHFVVTPNPAAQARHRLFVMLPGTGAKPAIYTLVVKEAAKQGYHGIGLAYDSAIPVGGACEHATVATCFGDVRMKMITGANTTPLVPVTPGNSIVHRLHALLRYLAKTYPAEGWDQYLTRAGEIDWTKVQVGGHSQGSGDAGFMTKLYPLARACFFSFGYDHNTTIPMPAWLDRRNVTPPSRMFAFINVHDEIVNIDIAEAEWKKLGMYAFGAPANVDGGQPPYGGSHILTTGLPPAPTTPSTSRYPEHSEVVVDIVTPKNPDGSPVAGPAWDTMCFP
jgi:hypothetical protein